MAITVTNIVAGPYVATGAAQSLPFAFKVFTPAEVEVIYGVDRTAIDPSLYTVTINKAVDGQVMEGGSILLSAGSAPAGQEIRVVAKPARGQALVFSDTTSRLRNLNEGLDRAALRALRAAYDGVFEGAGQEVLDLAEAAGREGSAQIAVRHDIAQDIGVEGRAQARDNLGLGNAATRNVGTTSGTVAAGDDARILDVANKATSLDPNFTGTVSANGTLRYAKAISGAAPSFSELGEMTFSRLSMINDRQNTASLYNLNGVGSISAIEAGLGSPHRGSSISSVHRMIVYNSDDGALAGWREYAPVLSILRARADPGYVNYGGNWWGADRTVAGPAGGADATKREQFLAGDVNYVRKLTTGNALGMEGGKPYWGSVGQTISTLPITAGGGSFGASDQNTSYPVLAGLDVAGWSGPWGTANGSLGAATQGFQIGVKIGGVPIVPWIGTNWTVRSKIGTGLQVQDVTDYGINVENPYATAVTLSRLAQGTLGATSGDALSVTKQSATVPNAFVVDSSFRRYAAGANWQNSEYLTRCTIDGSLGVGAWWAFRGRGDIAATDFIIGFGAGQNPHFAFDYRGVLTMRDQGFTRTVLHYISSDGLAKFSAPIAQELGVTTVRTPSINGEMVVEATSNTTLTFKMRGSDGVVRSATLTLS